MVPHSSAHGSYQRAGGSRPCHTHLHLIRTLIILLGRPSRVNYLLGTDTSSSALPGVSGTLQDLLLRSESRQIGDPIGRARPNPTAPHSATAQQDIAPTTGQAAQEQGGRLH